MGFAAQLKAAVTPRAALLLLGVLGLQLAFIASYLGAFHDPTPHRVPIAVVAPQQAQQQLADRLDALDGDPLDVTRRTEDRATAERALRDRTVDGVYVYDARGTADTLLVASGAGASVGQVLEEVLGRVAADQDRTVRTEDLVPAAPGDARGLSAFYLVIGWCVGGYLCAAILAMSYGARPAGPVSALLRLGALAVYALAGGVGGAVLAGPVLDALPAGFWGLAALGALTVFAVGAATLGLQALVGVVGVGVAILLVVIVGNPSAGGAYGAPLLPAFWREVGPFLPTGASTWSTRSLAYFDGVAMSGPLLVLAGWAVVGTGLALLLAVLRHRRTQAAEGAVSPAPHGS